MYMYIHVVTMSVSRHFVLVAAVLSVLCLWILYQGPRVSHIQVQPRPGGLATFHPLATGDEHDENRNGRPGSGG